LSAELTKTHSFRLLFRGFCPLGNNPWYHTRRIKQLWRGTSQRCAKNVYRDQSCGQFHTMRNVCWTLWRQKVLSVDSSIVVLVLKMAHFNLFWKIENRKEKNKYLTKNNRRGRRGLFSLKYFGNVIVSNYPKRSHMDVMTGSEYLKLW